MVYEMSVVADVEVGRPNEERTVMEWALGRDYIRGQKTLHPRRTLDQFYYSSLRNTSTRDSDQTISKWTGLGVEQGGRQRAHSSSRLIMVNQLWCWVLDESKPRL
jgi:hypothetical protein